MQANRPNEPSYGGIATFSKLPLVLDPAELAQGARGRRTAPYAAAMAEVHVTVTHPLGEALIERAGIRRECDGTWIDSEGRRTSAAAEALTWALVAIAEADICQS